MAEWVKDLVLSLQWLGLMLWLGFNPKERDTMAYLKKKRVTITKICSGHSIFLVHHCSLEMLLLPCCRVAC